MTGSCEFYSVFETVVGGGYSTIHCVAGGGSQGGLLSGGGGGRRGRRDVDGGFGGD